MRRLPYALREVLTREGGDITPRLNPAQKEDEAFRITERFAAFILANSNCARCGEPLLEFESHVRCAATDFAWSYIEPLVPSALRHEFNGFWNRHRANAKQLTRTARVKAAGGLHTRVQLQMLMALQESRCYYCFSRFGRSQGRWQAHLDHFVPICSDGTNDIRNLVYACAPCNIAKDIEDGEAFRASSLRAAVPQTRKELRRIHRAVERGEF
jgi:5-methylcytosine-specific restriction endonuclease McrA